MYDILLSIYIRRYKFNPIIFILKNYFYYASLSAFTTVFIMFLFPYIGSGPIYGLVYKNFFEGPCNDYWWANILLINNFYPQD